MSAKVSIAIPAYKSRYLHEAIQSVLNQTFKDFELIIVNDRSPEDINSIVTQFQDKRIRYYVNEQNLGARNPAYNWNKCLSYASGEFFALLCDDDLYEPDFIDQMLQLAEKFPKTDVFRSRANFIDSEGKETNRYASAPEWESWKDYLWHVCRNYRNQTISEWMFRRKRMMMVNGYALLPLAWYADYLSVFRFAQQGGIASTYRILVHFRLSGDNISSQDDQNTIQKIEASRLFRDAVAQLVHAHSDREQILTSLDWLLDMHLKYNLAHAPKHILMQLYCNRKQYGISKKNIWKALWK